MFACGRPKPCNHMPITHLYFFPQCKSNNMQEKMPCCIFCSRRTIERSRLHLLHKSVEPTFVCEDVYVYKNEDDDDDPEVFDEDHVTASEAPLVPLTRTGPFSSFSACRVVHPERAGLLKLCREILCGKLFTSHLGLGKPSSTLIVSHS